MSYPAKQAYQLLMLLGLRRSEVTKAEWSEFHPELRRLLTEQAAGADCVAEYRTTLEGVASPGEKDEGQEWQNL